MMQVRVLRANNAHASWQNNACLSDALAMQCTRPRTLALARFFRAGLTALVAVIKGMGGRWSA